MLGLIFQYERENKSSSNNYKSEDASDIMIVVVSTVRKINH